MKSQVTTEPTEPTPATFHLLKMMERDFPPTFRGRPPYWRPPVTPASAICYVPHWTWYNATVDAEVAAKEALHLDANGAYLGAIGSVQVAHSHLNRTGAWPEHPHPRRVLPGYYLIGSVRWVFDGTIVSPLGDSARLAQEDTLWIAHPTLVLLLELLEEGALGDLQILDSFTAQTAVEFRNWMTRVRTIRTGLLERREAAQTAEDQQYAQEQYDAFKEGYGMAVSMIRTGEKCKTLRPDWADAIKAQHSATMWRKAWRYTGFGFPLISMGAVDEITIRSGDLAAALAKPRPPFKYDTTGRIIGAMKPKPKADPAPQRATDVPIVPDGEDIL